MFTETIATVMVRYTANHVLHSVEEIAMELNLLFSFNSLFSSLPKKIE